MIMRSVFVRNVAVTPVAAKTIQRVICNLTSQNARLETLEDRPHTVIPMVMLLEGVHAGSDGPLYYPGSELGKTPASWNQKPIVVYHPEMNGVGISACDPVVVNTRKVGVIMNAAYVGNKLKAEAWIEQTRADKVDPRIMTAINNHTMMELSTGVFVDVEPSGGVWNEEEYGGVARNYRPDHLALLPDRIGACSIADGAGFIRNQAKKGGKIDPTTFMKSALAALSRRWGLTSNELSFDNIRSALSSQLYERLKVNNDNGPWPWICDVYSDFFVYEMEGTLYQLGYSASNTDVTLSGDNPEEVRRVSEYRTVSGAFVGNDNSPKAENTMNEKAKMILAILAAAGSAWAEKDRPVLEGLQDNQVKAIHDGIQARLATNAPAPVVPAPAAVVPPIVPAPAAATTNAPAPVIPAPSNIVTPEQWIAAAPASVQEVLRNGQDALVAEKAKLIGVITKNANNPFTPEALGAMQINQLRQIAQLAGGALNAQPDLQPQPSYFGQAPVTDNTQLAAIEALPIPSMDFSKK